MTAEPHRGATVGGRTARDSLVVTCLRVAVANLVDQRGRFLAALVGVGVALFLLLLQLSILSAAKLKVTALYDDFNFDLAIMPSSYQFLLSFDTVDRMVLDIARATGDVADTYGLNVDVVHWTEVPDGQATYNLLIGLDPPADFVRDRDVRASWDTLGTPHALVADAYSQPAAGPVKPGSVFEINSERMTILGQFKLGLFFYAEGATLVRNTDFARLAGRDANQISLGLIKVKPGVSLAKAKADIAAALPSGVLVLTKAELERQERGYFLSTKPVGLMIDISMVIAALVGVAIILQVLATEVANKIGEYAVLKAMGATPGLIYGIGMGEALVVGFGGLLASLVLGAPVLALIQFGTHLETGLNVGIVATMVCVTAAVALAAGALAVRRVGRADPASLF